ncbi:OsmC family peroxiredoxin [Marinilabiliaceae bacterium JC017]|nr:OsmC family peroxiredoxin [Marinilabiliaceae bacterium JC017]
MNDIKFRIKAQSENATKTVVKARNFEFIIDEPKDLGGNDEAANPVEYLLGSFAGCMNVMGHLIAKEMDMNLNGLSINMAGNLNPARLFGQSFDERAGYKTIEVTLKPDTDASPELLEKWKQAVTDRCPVSDNLKNATEVKLKVKA